MPLKAENVPNIQHWRGYLLLEILSVIFCPPGRMKIDFMLLNCQFSTLETTAFNSLRFACTAWFLRETEIYFWLKVGLLTRRGHCTCVYSRTSLKWLQGKRQTTASILFYLLLLRHSEEDKSKLDNIRNDLCLTSKQPDVSCSETWVCWYTLLHRYTYILFDIW